MKVHCPQCRTAYNVPEDRIAESGIKTTCKKCGAEILIRRESVDIRVLQNTVQDSKGKIASSETVPESLNGISNQPEEDLFSVSAMSPPYPRHRDARIFVAGPVILILILAGGYFVLGGAEMPSLKTKWNPITSFLRIITGGEVYETCESFIRENETLFQPFGANLQVSLIRQNIKSVDGRKTATVLVNSQGTKATGQVYFRLRKDGDSWRVMTAAMRVGKGKFQNLFPRRNSKTEGKI